MERATIVGEVTAGAGNPGGDYSVSHGFSVFIATSNTRSPFTNDNWEGTGVIPDVEVDEAEALPTALRLAYESLQESADDDATRTTYADLAGQYGMYEVRAEGDALVIQRGRHPLQRLLPAGEDRFVIENGQAQRLVFQRDRRGNVTSIVFERPSGSTREYPLSNP